MKMKEIEPKGVRVPSCCVSTIDLPMDSALMIAETKHLFWEFDVITKI